MANGTPSIGDSILGPGGQPLPSAPITPPAQNTRASEFAEFFKRPEIQAALIQGGATLLAPAVGESTSANVGRAISSAGAAGGRVGQERQRRSEVGERQEQLGRRTAAIESQAGSAQQIADQQLTIARERMDADASNLATQLATQFNIALVGGELRLMTELVRGEIENAFLQNRSVDVDGIIAQFLTTRATIGGGQALPTGDTGTPGPGTGGTPTGTGVPLQPGTATTGPENAPTGGSTGGGSPEVAAPVRGITDEQVEALRRTAPTADAVSDDFLRRMFANENGEFLLRKVYGDAQVEAWKARVAERE